MDDSAQYAQDSQGKVVQISMPTPNYDGTYAVTANLFVSTPKFSDQNSNFNKPFATYTWNIDTNGTQVAGSCFQTLEVMNENQDQNSGEWTQTWDYFYPGSIDPSKEDTVVLSGDTGDISSFTEVFSAGA